MKAHWDLADNDKMLRNKLSFTAVDICLIQAGLQERAVRHGGVAAVAGR